MKTKRFYSLLLTGILLCLLSSSANGQTGETQERVALSPYFKKHTITWQPTSLINGGLRFDYEQRIKGRHWARIAPTVYIFPGTDSDYWYDDYGKGVYATRNAGFGLDMAYKYYINRLEIVYCLGGINYHYNHVDYEQYDYVPFVEDGLTKYRYTKADKCQNFNRVGALACIGIQTPQRIGFYIDTYMGIGYCYTFYDKDKARFDDSVFGYGYRGFHFTGGFRIGFAFGTVYK